MIKMTRLLLFGCLCCACLGGCGDDSTFSSPETPEQHNIATPLIRSADIATAGVPLFLTASQPEGPPESLLEYHWSIIETPTHSEAILSSDGSAQCSLNADLPGHYRVQLFVSDGVVVSTPVYRDIDTVTAFMTTFGGSKAEHAQAIQQTSDNGFVITGTTDSYGAGSNDIFLVRTDALGNELWETTFGSTDADAALAIQETENGGFLLAGWSGNVFNHTRDILLIRVDADGNKLWEQNYGGVGEETAYALTKTADDHFILSGDTTSFGNGGADSYLVKVDSTGTLEWQSTQGSIGTERAYALKETAAGDFLITGYTQSYQSNSWDILLADFANDGRLLWEKTFGGYGYDWGVGLSQTEDGNILLLATIDAYTNQTAGSDLDLGLFNISPQGDVIWQASYGGANRDWGTALCVSDGQTVLAGYTESFGAGNWDVYLLGVDSDGNELWSRTFGGIKTDYATAMTGTTDGGYALVGSTNSFGAGNHDILFIKTDGSGYLPPSSTPLPSFTADEKESVQFDCASNFQGINGETLTYAAYGLPTGLEVDSQTGTISGLLPDIAIDESYSLTITATGPSGLSTALATTLTVIAKD